MKKFIIILVVLFTALAFTNQVSKPRQVICKKIYSSDETVEFIRLKSSQGYRVVSLTPYQTDIDSHFIIVLEK